MAILIPFASGKGGVGKSLIAANLAYLLAARGKTTLLADLDLGGANSHTILGVKNSSPGLGEFIINKERKLSELVIPMPEPHFFLLPGDGLIPGSANLSYFRKIRLLKELKGIEADLAILDLGAGTTYNTVDMWLACPRGFIVTSPEPTSILNAYLFLKTALYRLMSSVAGPKHPIRPKILQAFSARVEPRTDGPGQHLGDPVSKFIQETQETDPQLAAEFETARSLLVPRIIINMGKGVKELELNARLRTIARQHLGLAIEYIAFLPWEDELRSSVIKRELLARSGIESPFLSGLSLLADRICDDPSAEKLSPLSGFEDLQFLAEQAV